MVIIKLENCRKATKVTETYAFCVETNHPKKFFKYS